MEIVSRAKALVVDRLLRPGYEGGEVVRLPRVDGDLRGGRSGRSDYLALALRLAARWEKDRRCISEIVDALLLLEEVYGAERVLAAVKRPFHLLAAVTRRSSITSLAADSGFPTVGAFVGAEVEEEIRRTCQDRVEIVFHHPKVREGVMDSKVAGEYPAYSDWKEASLLAEGMGRIDLLPLLGALVLRLRKEAPSVLRALVEGARSDRRGMEHDSETQLERRRLVTLVESTVASLDKRDPSPLWRILRRALSVGHRDG